MVKRNRILRRLNYWYWRSRYLLLDTKVGVVTAVLAGIVSISAGTAAAMTGYMLHTRLPAAPQVGPVKAEITLAAYLIIMIVSAIISYALTPKPKDQKPQSAEAPQTEDGLDIPVVFGEVWIDDSAVLGWKTMGTDKIRRSSKK